MSSIIINKGKTCSVEGCNRNAYHKGMCNMHYKRNYRYGDVGGVETTRSVIDPTATHKHCSKCNTTKPISDFPKDINRPDGVFPYCKPCKVKYNHASIKEHWDAFMARTRKYWGTEKGKAMRQQSHRNRRAKQGYIDSATIQLLFDAFDNRCAYCGKKAKLSLDHIVPLHLGGAHSLINFAPACSSCNSKKSAKKLEDFVSPEKLSSIIDRIQRALQYGNII